MIKTKISIDFKGKIIEDEFKLIRSSGMEIFISLDNDCVLYKFNNIEGQWLLSYPDKVLVILFINRIIPLKDLLKDKNTYLAVCDLANNRYVSTGERYSEKIHIGHVPSFSFLDSINRVESDKILFNKSELLNVPNDIENSLSYHFDDYQIDGAVLNLYGYGKYSISDNIDGNLAICYDDKYTLVFCYKHIFILKESYNQSVKQK